MFGPYLPCLVIGEFFVWQRGLAPAGVDEPHATFLRGHECCGSFYSLSIMELERPLLAMLVNQVVYCSHSRTLAGVRCKCTEDSTGRSY